MSALAIHDPATDTRMPHASGPSRRDVRLRLVTDTATPVTPTLLAPGAMARSGVRTPHAVASGRVVGPRPRVATAAPRDTPVRLVASGHTAMGSTAGVRLSERGMLAVLLVFAVLAAAGVTMIVASFLAVSNAPLDAPTGPPQSVVAVGS